MFSSAIRSLMMHKLRSFLTVLGLVFGVAAVIIMLAVAEGANQEVQEQIASLGVKNIICRSIKPTESLERTSWDALEYGLKYDDLERVKEMIDTVVDATPHREFMHDARNEGQNLDARVVGVHPNYAIANRLHIAQGRFIQPNDLKHLRNICVIGSELAEKLFRHQSPMGRSVQIGNQHFFRIVGVTRYRTPSAGVGSSLSAEDFNRDIYIPLTTDRARIGETLTRFQQGSYAEEKLELSQITVQVGSVEEVKPTARVLEGLLSKTHKQTDFTIVIPLDLLEQAKATQRIFSVVLGSTAAISLLVGGIGIMNIMLASVSERTREIGIRRALGARQRDIVMQFLFETVVLSGIGTMIGLALGGVGVGSVEDGCETTRASEFGRGKTRLLSYFFSVADDWEMREMRFLRVSE